MYDSIKEVLLEIFRAPGHPPEAPAGTHDSQQTFRASPNFLRYQLMLLTVFMLVVGLALFVFGIVLSIHEPLYGVPACLLMGLLWALVFVSAHFIIRLEYDMRYYIITDRSMRIRKGVWSILEQTLTFVNVQNITVEQGPIERAFGISRLVVDTAGGGGVVADPNQGSTIRNYHRAVMSGLENAAEIRELIVAYLKKLPHSGGLGEPDDDSKKRKGGMSPAEIDALKEILSETKALRNALAAN